MSVMACFPAAESPVAIPAIDDPADEEPNATETLEDPLAAAMNLLVAAAAVEPAVGCLPAHHRQRLRPVRPVCPWQPPRRGGHQGRDPGDFRHLHIHPSSCRQVRQGRRGGGSGTGRHCFVWAALGCNHGCGTVPVILQLVGNSAELSGPACQQHSHADPPALPCPACPLPAAVRTGGRCGPWRRCPTARAL